MTDASPFPRAVGPAASEPAGAACRIKRRSGFAGVAAAVAALGLMAMTPAHAGEPGLSLQGGWMRMLISSRPAGGYFTLHNAAAQDRTLTGAASPACGSVMLHRSVHNGTQERMIKVAQVKVPAHGTLSFAPGGYHLMCMHPGATMRPGASVPMTLRFADGGTLTASFLVKGAMGK